MDNTNRALVARDFMALVEEEIHRHDRERRTGAGKQPAYPMMVVFLGDAAMAGFEALYASLTRVWPQYEAAISFVGARESGEYCVLRHDAAPQVLSTPELRDQVTFLFGPNAPYQNKNQFLVYYVLNTAQCQSGQDYERLLALLDAFRKELRVDDLPVRDMLIQLLDEGFSRTAVAGQIRNRIAPHVTVRPCSSEFIISNRRSDNTALGAEWGPCLQAAAGLIALSNNSDPVASGALFAGHVMTLSYVCEEKPYQDIANAVVRQLLQRLEPMSHVTATADQGQSLAQRLGVTDQGTLAILDQYVDQELAYQLPTPEQLELFPRQDMGDWMLSQLSADEFSRETLGAWDCFLQSIIRRTRDEIQSNPHLRQRWCGEYAAQLREAFTVPELQTMTDFNQQQAIHQALWTKNFPSVTVGGPLESGVAQLKQLLSSDEALLRLFEETIITEGERAVGMEKAWQDLMNSLAQVIPVRDENITRLYSLQVTDYVDKNTAEILRSLQSARSREDLESIIIDLLKDLVSIGECPIFSANLETELEARLQLEGRPGDAQQYIVTLLTGRNIPTYFRSSFALSTACFSAILMKTGTPLYSSIERNPNLPVGTYFYNTDYSNAVESLHVYILNESNLINDEEG